MTFQYRLLIVASDDPYPDYQWMRDHDPAHYSEIEDVWVLTRYDDVVNAFQNHRIWSSQRRGNLLNDLPERIGKTLGTTDPPKHTFARRLVNKAFTPRTIAQLEPKIQRLAGALAAQAREMRTLEFVSTVSTPYNASLLGTMFGVPDADFIQLRHWLDDFFLRVQVPEGQEPPQKIAMRHLREYLSALADDRLKHPQDDLMTAMLQAEDDSGQRLEYDQVVVTTMTFLVAGFESINNLFTNMAYGMALHPHVYRALKDDPAQIDNFVEESARWDAAAQGFVRSPHQDVELHGKVIPANAQVLLHIGAANRDERFFHAPDLFDLSRDPRGHLGFGMGIHFCIGAPLGRLMTQTLFREMLAVSECWDIDKANSKRVTTPNFRGFSALPLTL
ncbi:MAG: cytochrome P450 [bacterium]|nr:cytochrome P450 [bacterium]